MFQPKFTAQQHQQKNTVFIYDIYVNVVVDQIKKKNMIVCNSNESRRT